MYAINADDIPAYAHSLISDDADAPLLQCDQCGRQVDTYRGAHDEPDAYLRDFLFHVAYDHGAPATVLQVTRVRLARVVTASYPNLRFEETVWQAPARCDVRNGTYCCTLNKGHAQLHSTPEGYRFRDAYSALLNH